MCGTVISTKKTKRQTTHLNCVFKLQGFKKTPHINPKVLISMKFSFFSGLLATRNVRQGEKKEVERDGGTVACLATVVFL